MRAPEIHRKEGEGVKIVAEDGIFTMRVIGYERSQVSRVRLSVEGNPLQTYTLTCGSSMDIAGCRVTYTGGKKFCFEGPVKVVREEKYERKL